MPSTTIRLIARNNDERTKEIINARIVKKKKGKKQKGRKENGKEKERKNEM